MSNLKARVFRLKQASQRGQQVVVCVARGETEEQALARAGIIPAALHPSRLIVIVNRTSTARQSPPMVEDPPARPF